MTYYGWVSLEYKSSRIEQNAKKYFMAIMVALILLEVFFTLPPTMNVRGSAYAQYCFYVRVRLDILKFASFYFKLYKCHFRMISPQVAEQGGYTWSSFHTFCQWSSPLFHWSELSWNSGKDRQQFRSGLPFLISWITSGKCTKRITGSTSNPIEDHRDSNLGVLLFQHVILFADVWQRSWGNDFGQVWVQTDARTSHLVYYTVSLFLVKLEWHLLNEPSGFAECFLHKFSFTIFQTDVLVHRFGLAHHHATRPICIRRRIL